MSVRAFIGLGANLGDRRATLESALERLTPVRASRIVETPPWGVTDQPPFLNAVAEIETDLGPEGLLDRLQEMERHFGRTPARRWGPRTLDLDLLLYGREELQTPRLVVPHPRLAERRFVLEGLAELCPGEPIPGLGRTVQELLDSLSLPSPGARS
jgi:2-amino-4-hydroxy-6-hydroxymethyldihydropteridine diphosphokinase